jgi:hypothetical protein
VGSPAQFTPVGTSDPGCVTGNDGDTTYLGVIDQSYAHQHVMGPDIPAGALSPVNSAVMGVYARTPATDTGGFYMGSPTQWILGPEGLNGSYTLHSGNWPTFNISGINGVQTRLQTSSGGTINQRFTYIYRSIDYTLASGGFVFLLNLAGLGALPIVGALTDALHFQKYMAWRQRIHARHTVFTPDELRQAWREIRAYRFPRFFLPAVA